MYVVGTQWNHLTEIFPMSAFRICFHGEMRKNILLNQDLGIMVHHSFHIALIMVGILKKNFFFLTYSMKTYIVGTH